MKETLLAVPTDLGEIESDNGSNTNHFLVEQIGKQSLGFPKPQTCAKSAFSSWHFLPIFCHGKDGKLAFLAFNILDARAARRLALAKEFDVRRI